MRIGLLGGTFDPVHRGHLDVAEAARTALGLDRVFLVPARTPSHKTSPAAPAADRFAMVELAAASSPHLAISDIDMQDEAPVYTTETLERWRRQHEKDDVVCFVTGADAFLGIRAWKNFPAVLDQCHFVVVSRPGLPASMLPARLPDLAARMRQAPCDIPDRPAILLVAAPTAPVSATDIRQRLAAGASIAGLVPDNVAAYISRHMLYSDHTTKGKA